MVLALILTGSSARADAETLVTNDVAVTLRAILATHTNYAHILDGSSVYLTTTGHMDCAFDMAREVAPDLDLVGKLAQAVVDSSFHLRRVEGHEKYRFTNPQQDDCRITVLGLTSSSNRYSTTTVAEGEKFFGRFQALIYLDGSKDVDGKVSFVVHLYAYPESRIWRYVTRKVRSVQQYFFERVMKVVGISTRTYEAMAKEPERVMKAVEQYSDPQATLSFSQAEMDTVRKLLTRFAGLVPATNSPAVP